MVAESIEGSNGKGQEKRQRSQCEGDARSQKVSVDWSDAAPNEKEEGETNDMTIQSNAVIARSFSP